jgi:hypothetical protein
MEQGGVGGALIEREEHHVVDPRETVESATNLSPRVDAERAGTHLVHDDGDPSGAGQPPQLRVLSHETTDPQRVGRGDGDDVIGLPQRRRRRSMASWPDDVEGGFLVVVESAGHIDDRLFGPLATCLEGPRHPAGR